MKILSNIKLVREAKKGGAADSVDDLPSVESVYDFV